MLAAARAAAEHQGVAGPEAAGLLAEELAQRAVRCWGSRGGRIMVAKSSYRDNDDEPWAERVGVYAMKKSDYIAYRDPSVAGDPWDVFPASVALIALFQAKHGGDLWPAATALSAS